MIHKILFLSLVASTSWANFFVGNAGAGIITDGHVYLRDLYDAGIHKNPYIGTQVDEFHLARLPQLSFTYPKSLLAQKLTDINRQRAGLGDLILYTMNDFNWVMLDLPLTTIPINSTIDTPLEQVTIAGRYDNLIRINRSAWDRMNDENKVALIVHEMINVLLKPQAMSDGYFIQSWLRTAHLTAGFFSNSQEKMPDNEFYLVNGLNVENLHSGFYRRTLRIWQSYPQKIELFTYDVAEYVVESYLQSLCIRQLQPQSNQAPKTFEFSYLFQPFLFSRSPYAAGPGETQLASRFKGLNMVIQSKKIEFAAGSDDIKNCLSLALPDEVKSYFLNQQ